MANPTGKSGPRDKPFRDALRIEIAAALDAEDKRSLRRIARALLDKAGEGDVQAIREVADRLDGKVPQGIGGDDDLPPLRMERIERVIVDVANPNSESVPAAAGALPKQGG